MPTPFTHLRNAHTIISELPTPIATLLTRQLGAFLVGSVAPDSQHVSGMKREETHFFAYEFPLSQPPVIKLLETYPQLQAHAISDDMQRAFMAGYLAHLKMDEIWWAQFIHGQFDAGKWSDFQQRHLMLHALVTIVDDADYRSLPPEIHGNLVSVEPEAWLPFLPDEAVAGWRDTIAEQLPPVGSSQTLEVIGSLSPLGADGLEAALSDEGLLARELWAKVSPEALHNVQQAMYAGMRDTIISYLDGTG